MGRGWIVGTGAILALFALAYLASPYLAVRDFVAVAKRGDVEKLAASVDFAAVRAGLKPQLAAAVTARMERDPAMRGNPLAGLGVMLMPSILDRMVDSAVTPRGIATLVALGRMGHADSGGAAPSRIDYDYGYVALDRFRVTLRRHDDREQAASLIFDRKGLFGWRLVRVDIPQSTLAAPDASGPSSG